MARGTKVVNPDLVVLAEKIAGLLFFLSVLEISIAFGAYLAYSVAVGDSAAGAKEFIAMLSLSDIAHESPARKIFAFINWTVILAVPAWLIARECALHFSGTSMRANTGQPTGSAYFVDSVDGSAVDIMSHAQS